MTDSLRALILDFDGTIAETERFGHRVAYNRAFGELQLGWHWDEALYGDLLAVAGGKERLRHYIERYEPALPPRADIGALIADVYHVKVAISRICRRRYRSGRASNGWWTRRTAKVSESAS